MRSQGGLSSTPMFLRSWQVAHGAFHLEAPPPANLQSLIPLNPSPSHVHHSYMPDAAHTIHTGRFGGTLTHTSHEALCFGFAAEIKPGSVTFLYKGDKERLSRIQLVCLCACVFVPACVFIGENVCVVFSRWCRFYFYHAIFFVYLNWLSSLSSAKLGLAVSSITDSYCLLHACVCAWQHQKYWPGWHATA